jgi:hypothetical protein
MGRVCMDVAKKGKEDGKGVTELYVCERRRCALRRGKVRNGRE